jgi:HEAT repeat protein
MPLIKRDAKPDPAPSQVEAEIALDASLADLAQADPERRWSAARRLADTPAAASHLAAALPGETDPRVIEAIFTSLIRRGEEESAPYLLGLLRSDEATLRGGAIEALQTMPAAFGRHADSLLQDADSDVRIFAVELTRSLPPDQTTTALCRLLDREDHPNVCAAAVDVLADLGSRDAMPYLERCRKRFANVAFLTFAISIAIQNLSGSAARAR